MTSKSHLSVDACGERKVVEQVVEVLPDVGVSVLAQALVVEPVDLKVNNQKYINMGIYIMRIFDIMCVFDIMQIYQKMQMYKML